LPRRRLNNRKTPRPIILLGKTPEIDRLREITERAKQNFLEVWSDY
jgi:hypothetical protein